MHETHEFVLPTFGRSPHLEQCLASLVEQTRRSPITISTSTPFPGLAALAERYGARLFLHAEKGIGADWNAALGVSAADLVTLAHQDDIYLPNFADAAIRTHAATPSATFSFVDFDEIDSKGQLVAGALTHTVKRLLTNAAFAGRANIRRGWRRHVLLGFGNPIICAGVTIARRQTGDFRFRTDMHTNMDWAAWLDLSTRGSIARIPKRLVVRRAHSDSATSACLADGSRLQEDALLFQSMWPRPIAKTLGIAYRLSYRGYLP